MRPAKKMIMHALVPEGIMSANPLLEGSAGRKAVLVTNKLIPRRNIDRRGEAWPSSNSSTTDCGREDACPEGTVIHIRCLKEVVCHKEPERRWSQQPPNPLPEERITGAYFQKEQLRVHLFRKVISHSSLQEQSAAQPWNAVAPNAFPEETSVHTSVS